MIVLNVNVQPWPITCFNLLWSLLIMTIKINN